MADPLSLARMRTRRTAPVPTDSNVLSALNAAANFAGRRLVDIQGPDDHRVLMLGWPADIDPADSPSVIEENARSAPPSVLLTLAACIGCCWSSPEVPLFPGDPVPEEQVLAALARFTSTDRPFEDLGHRSRPAWKGALRSLRACGFLAPDNNDSMIHLGPELAAWSDVKVRQLRDRYSDLPGAVGRAG